MIELKNYEKFNKKFFNDMKYFFKIENSSLQFELIIQLIKKNHCTTRQYKILQLSFIIDFILTLKNTENINGHYFRTPVNISTNL